MTADTPLLGEEIERAHPANPACSGMSYVCGVLHQLVSSWSQRKMEATGIQGHGGTQDAAAGRGGAGRGGEASIMGPVKSSPWCRHTLEDMPQ